jgi:hypothetical protein
LVILGHNTISVSCWIKSKKVLIFFVLLMLCFGMVAYITYTGGGGSMFTCRDLGCECGNRCIGRHSGGQSRHLLMMCYDIADAVVDSVLL